jgi:hypothetical protein
MAEARLVGDAEATSEFEIDLQPDVSALRMFRSMSFTPWYALGEFVDNSITSALKNLDALKAANGPDYGLRVEINFESATGDLVITDNAAGITRTEMNRALRMGKRPQNTDVGLSRHGVGLKAAAFWWGAHLIVETYPLGEQLGWRTTINVAGDEQMDRTALVKPIPSRGHSGTVIRVKNLWQKTPQTQTKGAIRRYLPSIYRQFLGGGTGTAALKCELHYDGTPLSYEAPPLLNEPYWPSTEGPQPGAPTQLWRKEFRTELETGKQVSGWYGLLETMSANGSGFFLHYRGKGIAGVVPVGGSSDDDHSKDSVKDAVARSQYKPWDIFKDVSSHRNKRIVGEFDVSDFGKTISTDAPLWTVEEEAQFIAALAEDMDEFAEGQSLLSMAGNFRSRTKTRLEQQRSQNVQEEETRRVASSLAGVAEHVHAAPFETNPYRLPDPEPARSAEDHTEPTTFLLSDSDGHTHTFVVEMRRDRSADFVEIREDHRSLTHVIRINAFHSIVSDMPDEPYVERLVTRLALGLAASEAFATFRGKHQIRETMNDYLRRIGMSISNA